MERERVEIGGSVYFIRPYDPFLALEIMGDLQQRFLAPLLSTLDAAGKPSAEEIAAAGGDQEAAEAAKRKVMEAEGMRGIARLSAAMNGKELRAWAEKLLLADFISVAVDGADPGNPRKLDTTARALALKSSADIIELCIAVCRVNFAGIFTRAGSLLGAGRSLAAK